MKKTAVVILNFNGKHYLQKFLPDVVKYSTQADVVVADNASTDGSAEWLKENYNDVRLLEMKENFGFAGGYNRALKQLDYDYFVLLNSDVQVTPNWLLPLEKYMNANLDVVALQPKIMSYNEQEKFEYSGACGGFIDRYGYPFCRGRVFADTEEDKGQYDDIIDVMWASGACLMVRSEEYFKAGGLDDRFFAYQEEIDLCWRLNSRGKRIVCNPQSTVYHVGYGVLGNDNPFKTYLNFRNNLLLLYKNLPNNRLSKVMFVRWFLDYLAMAQMLFTGNVKNAKSVIKARKEFKKLKSSFKNDRLANIKVSKTHLFPNNKVFLLWQYYFLRRNKFSQLR